MRQLAIRGRRALSVGMAVILCVTSLSLTSLSAIGTGESYQGIGKPVFSENRELVNELSMEYTDSRNLQGQEKSYTFTYDPKSADVKPMATSGRYIWGGETLSNMAGQAQAAGETVIAAVNGSFFDTSNGTPLGAVITDGEVTSASYGPDGWRLAAFKADGSFVQGMTDFRITWQKQGAAEATAVNYLNKPQGAAGLYIYTDRFAATTKTGAGTAVRLNVGEANLTIGGMITGTVEEVLDSGADAAIGEGRLVLFASEGSAGVEALRALTAGDKVEVQVTDATGLFEGVQQGLCGTDYLLVTDGQVNPALYSRGDKNDAHPRTSIGVKADGTVVIHEVDGRQAGFSDGLTDIQTAEYMVSQGCVTALRLDGGGSSTAIARLPGDGSFTVLNRPSDGAERADTNGLLLLAKKPAAGDGVKKLHVYPGKIQILEGSKFDLSTLTVKATDSNFYLAGPIGALSYSADSRIGTVSGSVFTAKTGELNGEITVTAGGISAKLEVEVIHRADELRSNVPLVSVAPGTSYQVNMSAYIQGRQILASNDAFTWGLSDESLGHVDASGLFTAGQEAETGTLSVSAGGRMLPLVIEIGSAPIVNGSTEWKYLDTGADARDNATVTGRDYADGLPEVPSAWAYPFGSVSSIAVCTADPNLRIRATAPSGTQVGSIPQWATVKLLGPSELHGSSTWVQVDYNGVIGWSSADYLQIGDIQGADTGSWATGVGPFGVSAAGTGFLDSQTTLNQTAGGDSIPAYFFRTTFQVEDASAIRYIVGDLCYNDAAIVYLNGQKVQSLNTISYASNLSYGAASPVEGSREGTFALTDTSMLVNGENTLAVEIHQKDAASTDAYFRFKSLILSKQQPLTTQDIKNVTIQPGSDEYSRNFSWYGTSLQTGYVQIALKSEMSDGVFPSGSESTKTFAAGETAVAAADGYFSNHVTATGLRLNTEYVYRVGNGDLWSDTYDLTTKDIGVFNFLFAGDPQIGSSGSIPNDVKGWRQTLGRAMSTFPETAFLLSAGDQIETVAGKEAEYEGFFAPDQLRGLTLATTPGNHDMNIAYRRHFNVPNEDSTLGNTSANASGDYYFRYGQVLFMVLNSNNESMSEHKQFMEAAIGENQDAEWKVVAFHHAPYSTAAHTNDADILRRRANWVSAFDELNIDVVLNGHDHEYARSYQMEGGVPQLDQMTNGEGQLVDPTGIVYITANSASGSKYYNITAGTYDFKALDMQLRTPTISNIEMTPDSFTIKTYRIDTMEVVDTYSIVRTDVSSKALLRTAVDNAKALSLTPYTAASAAAYTAAVERAEELLNSSITADEARAAALELVDAQDLLVFIANKAGLKAAIAKADEAIASGEVDRAIPALAQLFRQAYDDALAIDADNDAIQAAVDERTGALTEALNNLVPAPDKSALTALVEDASGREEEAYTPASYAVLTAALTEAQDVLGNQNATPGEVQGAYDGLLEAIVGLKPAEINKAALDSAIVKAEALDLSKYYPSDTLASLLAAAQAVFANPASTQQQVDETVAALIAALADLRIIPDTEALKDLIEQAENLPDIYTAESLKAVHTALAAAKTLLAGQPDEAQVKAAYDTLRTAVNGLVPLGNSDTGDGNNTDDPDNSGNTGGSNDTPKTGSDFPTGAAVLALGSLALLLAMRKRHSRK